MINHFRREMPRPIVGIGHSMGGCHLVQLSLMHARLFTTLILIDPAFARVPLEKGNAGQAVASTKRRDKWPSRKAAEASFKQSKFYQGWDPRALDLWIKHGLRDLPTLIYPDADNSHSTKHIEPEVTLTTTKHQEVFTFMRPKFATADYPSASLHPNPVTHPDVIPEEGYFGSFYRSEMYMTFRQLPHLRPSVRYIFGELSYLSTPAAMADKLAVTGIGAGGSGGTKAGRVQKHILKGVGHLIPMEAPGDTADACRDWLVPELERWKAIDESDRAEWAKVPDEEKSQMSQEYVAAMTGGLRKAPTGKAKL